MIEHMLENEGLQVDLEGDLRSDCVTLSESYFYFSHLVMESNDSQSCHSLV